MLCDSFTGLDNLVDVNIVTYKMMLSILGSVPDLLNHKLFKRKTCQTSFLQLTTTPSQVKSGSHPPPPPYRTNALPKYEIPSDTTGITNEKYAVIII